MIEAGRLATVKKLLREGASIHSVGTLSRSALHYAAEYKRLKIAHLLIDAGARINARDYRKNTPLHKAAAIGSAELVKLLLRSGAKAGLRNTSKCTPLHEVSAGGGTSRAKDRVEIVEQLVDAGCVINARDSVGRTALFFASCPGRQPKARLAVIRALLDAGANPRLASRTNPPMLPIDAAYDRQTRPKKAQKPWTAAIELLER